VFAAERQPMLGVAGVATYPKEAVFRNDRIADNPRIPAAP